MATLYLRNGTYYLNYSANGKRYRQAITSDRQEAYQYLAEFKYRQGRGLIPLERPQFTFDYLVNRFFQSASNRISHATQRRYRSALEHFRAYLEKWQGLDSLNKIIRPTVQEYINHRLRCTPKPKAKTINLEVATLAVVFRYGVEGGLLEKNPTTGVKPLKNPDTKKGRVLTEEEIALLLSGCERIKMGDWFCQIIVVLLNTGMRAGELINLTWDDIDFSRDVIEIREKSFWSPKSYARTIPMNQTVRAVIDSLPRSHLFVFTYHGKQIPENRLRKKLLTLSRQVGLPHITRIHDFRHTCASRLLMAGVDVPTVSALLGHRSWSTTAIYSHQTLSHLRRAVGAPRPI